MLWSVPGIRGKLCLSIRRFQCAAKNVSHIMYTLINFETRVESTGTSTKHTEFHVLARFTHTQSFDIYNICKPKMFSLPTQTLDRTHAARLHARRPPPPSLHSKTSVTRCSVLLDAVGRCNVVRPAPKDDDDDDIQNCLNFLLANERCVVGPVAYPAAYRVSAWLYFGMRVLSCLSLSVCRSDCVGLLLGLRLAQSYGPCRSVAAVAVAAHSQAADMRLFATHMDVLWCRWDAPCTMFSRVQQP